MVDGVNNTQSILSQVKIADQNPDKVAFVKRDGSVSVGNINGRAVTEQGGPRGASAAVSKAFIGALQSSATQGLGGEAKAELKAQIKDQALESLQREAPSGKSRFVRPEFKLFNALASAVQQLVKDFKAQLFHDTVRSAVGSANNLVSVRAEVAALKSDSPAGSVGLAQHDSAFIERLDGAIQRLSARVEDLADEIQLKQAQVDTARAEGQTQLADELAKGVEQSKAKLVEVKGEIAELVSTRESARSAPENTQVFDVDATGAEHRGWVADAREVPVSEGGVKGLKGPDAQFISGKGLGPTIGDIPDLLDAFWIDGSAADRLEFVKVVSPDSDKKERLVVDKLNQAVGAGTIDAADASEIKALLKLDDAELRAKLGV